MDQGCVTRWIDRGRNAKAFFTRANPRPFSNSPLLLCFNIARFLEVGPDGTTLARLAAALLGNPLLIELNQNPQDKQPNVKEVNQSSVLVLKKETLEKRDTFLSLYSLAKR
ncbi:predicted protein [Arabidopsis lyrata subsp. lyrata]|uniref:Predicted protein n=1 Tax=Arabidopsis lyrata subsp. lyrata TaxID=81972 RepID=D7MVB7_ARALL|nr:predicted protein [Arabidopsis lyrata subsp. lyrata]